MSTLTYLVPGLLATGGLLTEWLLPDKNPEWADKAVFNDRMRQIHSATLTLNTALGGCQAFMAKSAELTAWRAFKTNWTKYYAEVGTLNYFGPNDAQISNAKLYASQLQKWIQKLQSYKNCATVGITAAPETGGPVVLPTDGASPSWLTPVLYTVGGIAILKLLFGGNRS